MLIAVRIIFTYYLLDSFITPEIFAESYCDDFDVNPLLFIPAIAQIIRQKVEAFQKKILDTQCDNKVFIAVIKLLFLKKILY